MENRRKKKLVKISGHSWIYNVEEAGMVQERKRGREKSEKKRLGTGRGGQREKGPPGLTYIPPLQATFLSTTR